MREELQRHDKQGVAWQVFDAVATRLEHVRTTIELVKILRALHAENAARDNHIS